MLLLTISCMAQSNYVTQSTSGNTITFKNVSSKIITEMGGALLEKGVEVGIYQHTFFVYGFKPGATEPLILDGQTAPSVNLKYINFKDGTSWKAPVVAAAATDPLSGQTLKLSVSESVCKADIFGSGHTLYGTWRNAATGCASYQSIGRSLPYTCASDPNYGYPDLAARTCRSGICCMIQYTAFRPTIAADTDCLAPSNGFYTGVLGEQK